MADVGVRRVYELDVKLSNDAIAAVRAMQKEFKDLEENSKKGGKAAKDAGKDAEEGSGGFNKLNFATVGARRELLVLVHELSQGNFQRFGGSLLVLGERIDATRLIMSAAGLGVIAFTATLVGLTAAAIAADFAHDRFNKTLTLTGNASGLTASSFKTYTNEIADATNNTTGNVKALLLSLTAAGVSKDLFGPLAESMSRFQYLTGETSEKVAAAFKNLANDPKAAVLQLNESIHFLSSTTYELIKRTQEAGDVEGAAVIAADAVSTALRNRQAPALSFVGELWEALGKGIDRTKAALVGVLTPDSGLDKIKGLYTQLADVQKQIDQGNKSDNAFARVNTSGLEAKATALRNEIAYQIKLNTLENDDVSAKANATRVHDAAVRAQVELDILDGSIKGRERYNQQVAKLVKEENAIVAERQLANPKYDPAQDAEFQRIHDIRLAKIAKENQTPADKALENGIRQRLQSLGEEDAALREQIKQYDEYGKKINNAALAKINFDIAQGKFRGASPADQEALRSAAEKVDRDQDIRRQQEGEEAVDKRIAQLRTEAEAQALNARDTAVAVEIGKLETSGIEKGTAAYESRAVTIKRYTNEIQDNLLAKKLLANEAATNDEVKRLSEETDLIGKATVERAKLTAVLQIEAKARKEIAENPGNADQINSSAARQIDAITTAIDKSYAAHRTFEAGTSEVFAKYIEDAGNAAAFSTEVLTGSIKQLEDVFVNFAKTGKLNFSSLFQFMADEFIRQSVKMTFANVFKEKDTQSAVLDGVKGLSKLFGLDFGGKAKAPGLTGDSSDDAETAKLLRQQGDLGDVTEKATTGLDKFGSYLEDSSSSLLNFGRSLISSASDFIRSLGGSGSGIGSLFGGGSGSSSTVSAPDDYGAYFANGGIMSNRGSIPLNKYAGGGIANSPQMAIFGEGRTPEAYVPLPDGRSIPVNVKHEQQGGGSSGMNVTIENHNGSDVSVKREKQPDGREQLRVFIKAAKQAMLEDVYGGGDFDKALTTKYGVSRASGTPRLGF